MAMSETKNFVVFRVAKLYGGRGRGSAKQTERHLDRHTESADISHPENSQYNDIEKNYKGKLQDEINKAIARTEEIDGRHFRKDAAVAVEMVFSYSPEADIDDNEYDEVLRQFLKTEFPRMDIMRIDYHADEATSHWHVVGIPYDEKGRLSAAAVLGGPKQMRQHQTNFAKVCEPLGLRRGIPKSDRKARGEVFRHKALSTWKKEVNALVGQNKALQAQNDFLKSDKYRQEILENDKIQQGQKIVNEIFKDDER